MSKYGIQVGLKAGDTFSLETTVKEISLLVKQVSSGESNVVSCEGCIAYGRRKLCNSLPRDCVSNNFIYVEAKQ